MCLKLFFMSMTVKKVEKKIRFFIFFLTFYDINLKLLFFGFSPVRFKTKADPPDSNIAKTRSTSRHTCVKYMGNIIFIQRITDNYTGDLNIFNQRCQNRVNFPDIIFNFSKLLCVLPSTLCMTGELRPSRFGTKI